MSSNPPRWADRFLEWYCHPDLLEDLQGDLYEVYQKRRLESGKRAADLTYVWLVIRSLRISAIGKSKRLKNSIFMMTANNFKIAFRVLARDKVNTAINLVGLTIGIACFLLMGLYVKQELSFDHFHSKKDRIYRSWVKEDYGEGKIFFNAVTPLRFEDLFEQNFPEVEAAVRITQENHLVGRGENRIDEQVAVISPDFFKVFDFEVVAGNREAPFQELRSVIISESYAKKYFGDDDPMGKVLSLQIAENIEDFKVSAVIADMPHASSIRFDIAVSAENSRRFYGEGAMNAWFSVLAETYVLIRENADVQNVNDKMQDVVMGYLSEEVERGQYNIGLQPLTDIHLNPDVPAGFAPVSNPQYVYILGAIGLLVLIIACINYATLSIGQSLRRAREVGMRKVLGAGQSTLVVQYLSESLLLALIAMAVGTVLTILLVPTFNALTGTQIFYTFKWWHLLAYLGVGLAIGVAAGIYPAFVLSGFRIVSILRGGSQGGGRHVARKGMLVFQFLVTVFLISTTLIMRKQVSFMQEKDLGFTYKSAVSVTLQPDPAAQRLTQLIASGMENGKLLKAALQKHPDVTDIGMATHVFGSNGWTQLAYTDDKNVFRRFAFLNVDANYLRSFGIKVKEGRDFEEGNGLDERQSIIVNQAAADYFGLENPIGDKLPGKEFGEHRIIGVTDNFNFTSLHSQVEPLVIAENAMPILQGISDFNVGDSPVPKLVFTYTGPNLADVQNILDKEWEAIFPNEALDFSFVDQKIQQQYENEARLNKLITVATILSIVIAILGLLGLMVLVVNSRIKEIGIRKVMGATPITIFALLSKSFISQLLVAIVLSVPLTLWLMSKWLANFAYRTEIGVGLFVVSGMAALLVAALVIVYHTLRASRINPVESLRVE
ncbi:MAG: ABC transporter permease [Imperialibacter sp.]|uniref:ABC transporter permease n=1 Tax=Imperialibacter sp. TaxID=2038411 RepID=UPI003A8B61E8